MDFNQAAFAFLLTPREGVREVTRKARLLEGVLIYIAAMLAGLWFFMALPGDLPSSFDQIFPMLSVRPLPLGQLLVVENLGIVVDALGVLLLWLLVRAISGKLTLAQSLGLMLWIRLLEFPVLVGSQVGVMLRSPEVCILTGVAGLFWSFYVGINALRGLTGIRAPFALLSLIAATLGSPALASLVLVRLTGLVGKEQMMLSMMMR